MGDHDGHRERLRKRFLKDGMDVLQDDQVLELLLFYALPRQDTNALARRLLKQFGSMAAVLDAPMEALKEVSGIGENAAVLLHLITPLARRYQLSRLEVGQVLLDTQSCGAYLSPFFFGAKAETVYLLCLDAKCKVLGCKKLQEGSVNMAGFSLRKAAEIAINTNATSVVLAHNHTNGMAIPSKTDVETTLELKRILEALGVCLVDHIIVADNDFVSLADNGLF